MSDAAPDSLFAPQPVARDRRIVATAAVSVALHLLVIGLLVAPRLHLPQPSEPPAIQVDLVPPPELSSAQPVSSEAPSSQPPSASEAPSSEAASSAEPASAASAAPSSADASSEEAASSPSEAASAAAASAPEAAPAPRSRPIVIPVGPQQSASELSSAVDNAASEASSAASGEGASAEADDSTDPGDGTAASDEPPPITGALHTAKHFYFEAILTAPSMAKVRDAIKTLPPEKRLAQTCNLEAVGQLGQAGKGYAPDALVADVFAKPMASGNRYTVSGGAFRSKKTWFAIAFDCVLSTDLTEVKSFTWRVGDDVTAMLKARIGG